MCEKDEKTICRDCDQLNNSRGERASLFILCWVAAFAPNVVGKRSLLLMFERNFNRSLIQAPVDSASTYRTPSNRNHSPSSIFHHESAAYSVPPSKPAAIKQPPYSSAPRGYSQSFAILLNTGKTHTLLCVFSLTSSLHTVHTNSICIVWKLKCGKALIDSVLIIRN